MKYEDILIEDCLRNLKKEMRYIKYKNKNDEYRINRSKIKNFRIPLLKLLHFSFMEGVYVGKGE